MFETRELHIECHHCAQDNTITELGYLGKIKCTDCGTTLAIVTLKN